MHGTSEAFRRVMPPATRRHLLLGALGALFTACTPSRTRTRTATRTRTEEEAASAVPSLTEIEARVGGRVGVFAIDTGTGEELAHRADERFAMCSTFKWALAAAVLARVDRKELSLDDRVGYGEADLLDHAPETRAAYVRGERSMSLEALARAAVVSSDNTAANLLLGKVAGPAGLTRFVQSIGDAVTRFDRNEPGLNENAPGDPRDTTSPRAMVALMRAVLQGNALSDASRTRLIGWLRACETGKDRLRAGLPQDWTVGDKTGTGARGAFNDVAIATPPGRAPVLVAAYLSDGRASAAALADIGRLVGGALGG
jgi:beta-lactamase class A